MKRVITSAVAIVLLSVMAGSAYAVPRLQTYIVGSDYYNFYRQEFSTWITRSSSFDLKVIGYWHPAGLNSGMLNCKPTTRPGYDFIDTWLQLTVPKGQSGTVWINGVELTGFGSYWSKVPSVLNPTPSLRRHMPAGIGLFNYYHIGPIDNDQVNAYEYSYGRIGNPGWGDEILVSVVVSGYDWVHFDAVGLDSYGCTHANPFSHDASYYEIPEPGTLSLLGIGLLGLVPILRRKRD